MSFYDKYLHASKKNNSYVCIGLDSDVIKMPTFLLTENNPMLVFNKRIIEATIKYACCYKLNFAFYLSQGERGIQAIKDTIDYINNEVPVILDIKAGDIGNTMSHYAITSFKYFNADAMTINTMMGSDVLNACLEINNAYCFVLALTSNDSANEYLKHNDLYKTIAKDINSNDVSKVGAVVGATRTEDFATMRQLMPKSIFLVPGIGAQGGDLAAVCKYAIHSPLDPRIIINSSRNIIFADNSESFATVAANEANKLREKINELIETM